VRHVRQEGIQTRQIPLSAEIVRLEQARVLAKVLAPCAQQESCGLWDLAVKTARLEQQVPHLAYQSRDLAFLVKLGLILTLWDLLSAALAPLAFSQIFHPL
jgi:hypothetical protein